MKAHQAGSAPVKGPGKALLEAMLALRSEQEVTRRGPSEDPLGQERGGGQSRQPGSSSAKHQLEFREALKKSFASYIFNSMPSLFEGQLMLSKTSPFFGK